MPDVPFGITEGAPGQWEQKVLDASAVIFLFNGVNRIASAYGLAPEWSWCRRGEWVRRITRPLMSRVVRSLLFFRGEEQSTDARSEIDWQPLFRAIGYPENSPVGGMLGRHPKLAEMVHRLLSAIIGSSQLGKTVELLIARACLKDAGDAPIDIGAEDGVVSPPSPSEDASIREAVSRYADKLFARPHSVSASDLTEVRQQGLDAGKILDLVFRVSVLAAIAALDAEPLQNLMSGSIQ